MVFTPFPPSGGFVLPSFWPWAPHAASALSHAQFAPFRASMVFATFSTWGLRGGRACAIVSGMDKTQEFWAWLDSHRARPLWETGVRNVGKLSAYQVGDGVVLGLRRQPGERGR